jgi:putative tricarboxylic transport membrane protein
MRALNRPISRIWEGGETVRDFIRPLAVFLDHRVPQFDAPPINEVLQPYGISVPLLNGSMRALVAPAGFKKRHPQDYETLVAAYRRTLDNADFQVWFKATVWMANGSVRSGPRGTSETISRC